MSYEAVANGELAAVVTYLEMRSPADQPAIWSPLSLKHVEVPQPEHYRDLFRLIGAINALESSVHAASPGLAPT